MSYIDTIRKNTVIKEDAVILGIESSCDETAVAIVKGGRQILADRIISSAMEHAKFGGVVPEIASRMHTTAIMQATEDALNEANLTLKDIDAVAVTYGAGLLGALLVGLSYAKALALSLNIPLIPVNHIRGHLAAPYLADTTLKPPFISLLASGGHTAIICVKSEDEFKVLGSTLDDAVGEAFDKVSRALGLGYPGGPKIEALSKEGKNNVPLPKMFKGEKTFNVTYSGLKTAVINYVHQKEQKEEPFSKADVACSFQCAAIDVLVSRVIDGAKQENLKTVACGGGVIANGYLREKLTDACNKNGLKLVLPEKRYCTDNACMIAAEGYIQYKKRNFADVDLNAVAHIPL